MTDFASIKMRHDYVQALEEEKRKIQVFQRELPLCLELVSQAIETCKKELNNSGTATEYNMQGQSSDSSDEQTQTPVLEEFIPLKTTTACSSDSDHHHNNNNDTEDNDNDNSNVKSDWLRSVQLWNQSPDPPSKDDQLPRKTTVVEVKTRNGGAFQPFHRAKPDYPSPPVPTAAASSTSDTVVSKSSKKEDKEGQSSAHRKQRRCWSPELHRRFLQALQQLGGSHAATPKQIRELMKVDGLTNDEVKSHLQKYRLHTRRPSPTIHSNNNPQAPQFVVVGGIWVPPPDYTGKTSGETGTGAANGIYAPLATPPTPTPMQVSQSEEGTSHNSPATSSSTHTTTTSPASS